MRHRVRIQKFPFVLLLLISLWSVAGFVGVQETSTRDATGRSAAAEHRPVAQRDAATAEDRDANMDADAADTVAEDASEAGDTTADLAAAETSPDDFFTAKPFVRGIYVGSNRIGIEEHANELIALCDETALNAMVIDVKNEQGFVTFRGGIPYADALGITVRNIPDIQGLLTKLREHNIYTVARIVTFLDNNTYALRPELYIENQNGGVWRDAQRNAWLNPYNRDAWDFVLEIAKGAAALGFDEIQFDYIRFAASDRLANADFGDTEAEGPDRMRIIEAFARHAMTVLKPLGVNVSADVYGTIINIEGDAAIVGQNYTELAKILDFICPMIYPSHYADNSMGLDHPDLYPYETIAGALRLSNEKLAAIPAGRHVAGVRPWLQDFTMSGLRYHSDYGAEERERQISAVYDAGLNEWLLWDASIHYDGGGIAQNPHPVPNAAPWGR
jgi:hypothetical protein